MYFNFSTKKIALLSTIVVILMISVITTFELKTSLYGESRFHQIVTRMFTNEYRTLLYTLRRENMEDGLVASATSQNNPGQNNNTPAAAIPVLTYHAIISSKNAEGLSPESFEGHNVGLKEFEDHMFTLKENGWETITLEEFQAFIDEGAQLPERSFLLTFDDGSKESFYPVDPILKVLGYEAVTFILPEYSGGDGTYYYLSENEIQRARESGRWEVGSHGYRSHTFVPLDAEGTEGAPLANRIWLTEDNRLETLGEYQARVALDLSTSKKKLEDMFGTPIHNFAFPFGEFGQISQNTPNAENIVQAIAADVYDHAFYQWWAGEGFTSNYPEGQTMIKRISAQPTWSGADLLMHLQNGLPKKLPYTDTLDTDHGWLTTWGDFSVDNSTLTLASADDSSGASIILDGTKHWENYAVHMDAESPQQTGFAIFMRFVDNNNYAVCNIGNGFAHVEQVVNGQHRVIKGNRSPTITIPSGPFTIDLIAEGRSLSCAVNGEILVDTTFLDQSLQKGGIGIKVWDREIGKSSLLVDTLTVEER